MILLCALLAVVCVCSPTLASSDDLRNDPRLPIQGTKNWELLKTTTSKFSPRHSHATCIFLCPHTTDDSECIWLTGGYSDEHRSYDGEKENENADVWCSKDGKDFTQVTQLYGDFHQGNVDAKEGGYTAPFYGRYGHTLNSLDYNGDGKSDVMVLIGGYSPAVSNDVWITTDGIEWLFDEHAPWSKRGYHSATVFNGKLWVMGGSPLSNDVWSGTLLLLDNGRYHLDWQQVLYQAPWTPRAGSCLVTQVSRELAVDNSTLYTEHMFLLGGLAIDYKDETRTRNDVWKTQNGTTWELVGDMPWGSRAFHACTSWSHLDDDSRWIGDSDEEEEYQPPRIFLTGGGYMGTRGNNEVRELEAFTDTWWSEDLRNWTRVNYQEGSIHQDNLFSTSEWTETYGNNRKIYRGKWGHSLEAFHTSIVDEVDGTVTTTPSLFVIGGKLEGQEFTNDVFVSKRGIHCEKNGISCSNNGVCGELACDCHSGVSYCEPKKMPILLV